MKKMIISVFMALMVIFSLSVTAFAHPASFASGSHGTVSGLITVKKPDSSSTATMKTTYSVTGVGSEGVSVCFYIYDGENYIAQKNASDKPAAIKLGASGVFYRQIALNEGLNRICVRAEKDGEFQLVYLSINMIKNEVMRDMDMFSPNLGAKYNGWLD